MAERDLRPDSRVVHAGQRPEPTTGAVMPPIFTSSTYAQSSPGVHAGFDYIRSHNPTRYALERMVAALEGNGLTEADDLSCGGFAFASGMAAIATVLELIDANAKLVAMDDLYGGTNRLFSRVRARSQGLDVHYVDMTAPGFEEALCAETAMVWVETPTNPTLKLVDLEAVAAAARAKNPGVLLVCDNTFASPMNQSPLAHGFDIVIHSTTKYLNGHSDALGGVAVAGTSALAERLRFLQNSVGAVMGPFDCYLVLRGIKTLGVRMARHNASGRRIAEWLQRQDMVERVVYPGLADHPQRHVYEKQMRGGTGMITFFIHGGLEAARAFLENVRVFALAESLGGVESLVDHPAIMTHASVPPEMRRELGITDTLIRLSVGVEDCDDLLGDLESALAAAGRVAGVRA